MRIGSDRERQTCSGMYVCIYLYVCVCIIDWRMGAGADSREVGKKR